MKSNIKQLMEELKKNKYPVYFGKDFQIGEKTSTGIYGLDFLLSGGIGTKHRLEFWGKESSGKTLLSLLTIKKFQEKDKTCVFIDAENSFNADWAAILGVDVGKLIIINPSTLEETGEIMVDLVNKKVDLIVLDSIASLIPETELERALNEPTMALSAKINSLICRKLNSALTNSDTSLIFINQLREKVGLQFGNPFTSAGGHALLHFYDTRIEFKLGKPIIIGKDDTKETIGCELLLTCRKNKRGIPNRTCSIDFYYNGHLDQNKSLFFAGLKNILIERKGNTYKFGAIEAVGQEKFLEIMTEKEWKKLEQQLLEKK